MATMVRVDDKLHATLRELAAAEHRPIGQVIEDAVARYKRDKFWLDVEASVERLRADSAAWKSYRDEVAFFEGGSMDGLDDEDPYFSPEQVESIRGESSRTQGG